MSSVQKHRISQRQPKACRECTKRKIKCDKREPCTGCASRSIRCIRETVRISKADTVHRGELEFLRRLAESLEESQDLKTALSQLRHRIWTLEHGPQAPDDSFSSATHGDQSMKSPTAYIDPGPASVIPSFSASALYSASQEDVSQQSEHTSADARDHPQNRRGHASKIDAIEFLAWGRHTGKCFPHRSCQCRSVRPYAEMVSVNADPQWIGILRFHHKLPSTVQLSIDEARELVQFHFDNILWHHNVFHGPTFLMQCEEFWSAGTVYHPLWVALYLSVLAVSSWTVLNTPRLHRRVSVSEALVRHLFRAMISTLYEGNFLENISLYSIQAIVLSTRIAHNLGVSDFNATLVGAAIRIGHCLGLHKIADDVELTASTTGESWYLTVETEVGRRCWLQLIIQDYFQIQFTHTYMIPPSHFSTGPPRNCHDEDMIEQHDQVPTINSYIRTLSRIALLFPSFFDGLGTPRNNYSLDDAYKLIHTFDLKLRALVNDIPTFLLCDQPTLSRSNSTGWIAVARRSLSISIADKIIMIHRPVILHAFQVLHPSRTRKVCVSAALAILREHEVIAMENVPSLWTHSAFCVTAAMVIGLELLFQNVHTNDEASKLRSALTDTAVRLRTRKCDVIAERGAALIDTFLEIEEQLVVKIMRSSLHGASVRPVQLELVNEIIEKNNIVAKFLELSHKKPGAHSAQIEALAENSEQWFSWFTSDISGETGPFNTDHLIHHYPTTWDVSF